MPRELKSDNFRNGLTKSNTINLLQFTVSKFFEIFSRRKLSTSMEIFRNRKCLYEKQAGMHSMDVKT